jgi:hypothetical protein
VGGARAPIDQSAAVALGDCLSDRTDVVPASRLTTVGVDMAVGTGSRRPPGTVPDDDASTTPAHPWVTARVDPAGD